MRVTPKQLAKVIKGVEDNNILRELLRDIFSRSENIDSFAIFMFPETCTNKIPDFHKELYEILFKDGNDAFAAPRGHAKNLEDSTPILTTKGWKKHGDLKVGDYVYSISGERVKIIRVSEESPTDYVVETRDGERIRCGESHKWTVLDRNRKKEVTLKVKNMLGDWEQEGKRSRFLLPLREALISDYRSLPIDPYFFGLWLGDGHKDSPSIIHNPKDTQWQKYIPYKPSSSYPHKKTGVMCTYFGYQGLMGKIRKLKVYKNKHIPKRYLLASKEQRLALLAGLLDSDGHVDKIRGRIRFVNTNLVLVKDVESLMLSLGMRPYITSQEGYDKKYPNGKTYYSNRVYTVNATPIEDIPLQIPRKIIRRFPKRPRLGIVRVSYDPNGSVGKCITVDSHDGLYLAGKRFIPTHNSSITGLIFLIFCIVNKLERYIVYISQNHSKTVQFLDPIRYEIKNNPLLKFVYGNMRVVSGHDEEGKDREDCFDVNGIRVEAVSFEKNLRGFKYRNMRPTLIIGDDIEEDMRTLNPELRVKDENKLNKVIIPSLDINGRFKMIGTLLHIDSLLMKKVRQYSGKIYTACDEDFSNILWDDRFTKEKLMAIKKDIGSIAFSQEYLNNPVDVANTLIKPEWIKQCFDETISIPEAQKLQYSSKVMGADFAFSDRITADKSAYCSLGLYDCKKVLFHCETFKGLSVTEQMGHIENVLHKRFKYDGIGLEENSIKAISKDLIKSPLPFTLFWTGANDPAEKKTGYNDYEFQGKRHTVGKINLIMRLGTAFENSEFRIPYKTDQDKKIAHDILSECTSYALADGKLVEASVHPDIPIGLGYALELMNGMNEVLIDW